jgi:hypothetical protein
MLLGYYIHVIVPVFMLLSHVFISRYEELYKLRENLSFFGLESRECGRRDPSR